MTNLEVGLILFVFVFLAFWIICVYARMGQLVEKLRAMEQQQEAFQKALEAQVGLNDSVQHAFSSICESTNERFAAVAERLNTEGYRD